MLTGLRRAIEFLLIAWPTLDRVNELADHPEWYHLLEQQLHAQRRAFFFFFKKKKKKKKIRASLPALAGK